MGVIELSDGRLAPWPRALAGQPERTIVRVGLGLTAYLEDPAAWARGHAAAVLQELTSSHWGARLAWHATSISRTYRPIGADERRELAAALGLGLFSHVRHLFEVRVVDAPGAPHIGFVYREAAEGRAQAAYLQILLPLDTDANELMQWALSLAQQFPVASIVAGYDARFDPCFVPTAFAHIYRWSRRYWGLDVQYPSGTSCGDPLPSVSWLTFIGDGLARRARVDVASIVRDASSHDIAVLRLRHGTLIRAGSAPSLGDANLMQHPSALARVSACVEPLRQVCSEARLPGPFANRGVTESWRRRFIDPAGWSAAP